MPTARIAPLPCSNLAREARGPPFKSTSDTVNGTPTKSSSTKKETSMATSKRNVRFDPHCQTHLVETSPREMWWTRTEIQECRRADQLFCDKSKVQTYLKTSSFVYRRVYRQERIENDSLVAIQEGLDLGFRGLERWCSVSGKERLLNAKEIVRLTVEAPQEGQAPVTPEALRQITRSLTQNSRAYARVLGKLDAMAAHSLE